MGCSFWAIAAESDDQAASVASANFPNLVHIKCVEHITEATLSPFFQKRQVRGVILGGGSPCQGNTVLNNQRLGLQDERSWQPFELCRIKKIIEQLAPDCEIVSLLENVASMPQQVLQKYNEWMGFPPVQVSAGQCGWVQRNRFIWLGTSSGGANRDMEVPVDWQWQASPGSGIPVLGYAGKKPIPARVFFHQGFQVLFDPLLVLKNKGKGAMHPFTREFFHPTDRTPFSSPEAVGRFYEDNRRYPPAAYEEQSLLWRHSTWRQPEPEERAQLMGWPSQLTSAAPPNSQCPNRATRNSFIGNGFHIPTLLAVLSFIPQLLAGKIPQPLFPVDELQLSNRLQGTIWEPDRIYSFPGLLTSSDITYQMKSCFPGLELPPAIWEHVEQRLGVCDLPSLQCFPAWQRLRGQEWQLLGPIPLDGRARTRIFAGLTGQRYPGTSKKGLDHILPPGLHLLLNNGLSRILLLSFMQLVFGKKLSRGWWIEWDVFSAVWSRLFNHFTMPSCLIGAMQLSRLLPPRTQPWWPSCQLSSDGPTWLRLFAWSRDTPLWESSHHLECLDLSPVRMILTLNDGWARLPPKQSTPFVLVAHHAIMKRS